MQGIELKIITTNWPVRGEFRISRSALTAIPTVIVELSRDGITGRGECRPYSRYDESVASVSDAIENIRPLLKSGITRIELQSALPAGAARNAVDCAYWDLEAKSTRQSVSDLLALKRPSPRITAYTLSLDSPASMAAAAVEAAEYPLLKMKINAEQGIDACHAVLAARPDAKLIIDANESISRQNLGSFLQQLKHPNIALIEQPLPAGADDFSHIELQGCPPLCADESLHTAAELDRLWNAGYRCVNVKLDKCGGLTAGAELMHAAQNRGFKVMAGCMVASSLSMAPMMYLESLADFIDLDGPLLLSEDIENGIIYEGAVINPPSPKLWGF